MLKKLLIKKFGVFLNAKFFSALANSYFFLIKNCFNQIIFLAVLATFFGFLVEKHTFFYLYSWAILNDCSNNYSMS